MATPTRAQAGFEPDDIFLERRITDVELAPDSRQVVLALGSVDRDGDRDVSHLWLAALDDPDAEPWQLTCGDGGDHSPRWSPDGRRIAFLASRDGGPEQVHLIAPDGGEARPLTRFRCAVVDIAWRSCGTQLAAVCAVHVDPARRGEDTLAPDPQREPRDEEAPEFAWRLPYKSDGTGYTLDTRRHIALVDAFTGASTMLTRGDFDVGDLAWSPDGRRLAYSRSREEPGEAHCSDLWVLDVGEHEAAGEPRSWRCQVASAGAPAWSPDGRWVAFTGAEDEGDPVMRPWLRDVDAGQVRALGNDATEVVQAPLRWSADSRRVAFIEGRRGAQRIAAIDIDAASAEPILDPPCGQVTRMTAGERIAYVEEGADHPQELHVSDWRGATPRRLSDFNGWWRDRVGMRVERRSFEVPDGRGGIERAEGWLLLSPGRRGRRPLLVDVHGGPASFVKLRFSSTPYWQVLASRGWAVLAIDAAGSSSYGPAFTRRLHARWGELDLPQHLAAVQALRRQDLVDERAAIVGASYGGFMAAWAIGHCDAFRAAVVIAPVANLESHFGTSDGGYYSDPYSMHGKPEDDRQLMLRLSPMAHIEGARAPTLLLQGKDDQRCPAGQSEELFVKLRRSGTTAEMVLYPGGSHSVLVRGKPSHRLDGVQRIVEWLERWIDEPLAPPARKA